MLSKWLFAESLPTWVLLLEMGVSGLLVVLLARRLTSIADKLADDWRLGKAWVGMLLLAGVTSLPEVVTGCTGVAIGNPDLAFASIFGSCSFNIVLIVLLNAVIGGGSILGRAEGGQGSHTLTSSFGIILISLVLLNIFVVARFVVVSPIVAHAGEAAVMLIIFIAYINFVRLTYRFEHTENATGDATPDAPPRTARPGLVRQLAIISVLLVAAAWWLTQAGDVLASHPIGWLGRPLGDSFVGAAFLALATSLPEVVTCLAAVKIHQLDLALGNIFGSNMFNILVVPMLKVVSLIRGDRLLCYGDHFNAMQNGIAGALPILLTGIAVAGLTYRTKRRLLHMGFDSFLLGVAYVVGMYLLFAGTDTGG